MRIVARPDAMPARRKMRSRDLAERVESTERNLSLLKSGKVKGIRFDALAAICAALDCQVRKFREAPAGERPGGALSPPSAALPWDDLRRRIGCWPGPPAGVFGKGQLV